jgi:GT2 family glycosyltransferase
VVVEPDTNHSCEARIRLVDVELSAAIPPISAFHEGRRYPALRSLVRLHGRPLGVVDMALGAEGIPAEDHVAALWRSLGQEIRSHLGDDGLQPPASLPANGLDDTGLPLCIERREALKTRAPFASVVVATRDRPTVLPSCLASLRELDYPAFEIIVVDNAPATGATRTVVMDRFGADERVRYLSEDRPGLASAHNRGLAESKGSIVAFVDDDVVVDRLWLLEITRCFELAEDIGCVTGMIYPAELETPAQVWAEHYWGLGKGFAERRFDLAEHRDGTSLYPYAAGAFGSGANMAFRKDALRRIGGFDPAIGAGTAALGGDDLAAFFGVVTAGYAIVYSPAALVRHRSARDYESLRRQAYGYGVGLTAYLTKVVLDDPRRLHAMSMRVPRAARHLLRRQSGQGPAPMPDYPSELKWLERKGMLRGPAAYLSSRRRARREMAFNTDRTDGER